MIKEALGRNERTVTMQACAPESQCPGHSHQWHAHAPRVIAFTHALVKGAVQGRQAKGKVGGEKTESRHLGQKSMWPSGTVQWMASGSRTGQTHPTINDVEVSRHAGPLQAIRNGP